MSNVRLQAQIVMVRDKFLPTMNPLSVIPPLRTCLASSSEPNHQAAKRQRKLASHEAGLKTFE
jgi:hypothetical protein